MIKIAELLNQYPFEMITLAIALFVALMGFTLMIGELSYYLLKLALKRLEERKQEKLLKV